MKYNELNLVAKKDRKRVGRGIGSGYGKTAGRGTKGQNSRTGGGTRPGFEGGQNPLLQRIPKLRGFTSRSPKGQIVHTDQLEVFKAGSVISPQELYNVGLIKDVSIPVKILLRGKPTKTFKLVDIKASKAALQVIKTSKNTDA